MNRLTCSQSSRKGKKSFLFEASVVALALVAVLAGINACTSRHKETVKPQWETGTTGKMNLNEDAKVVGKGFAKDKAEKSAIAAEPAAAAGGSAAGGSAAGVGSPSAGVGGRAAAPAASFKSGLSFKKADSLGASAEGRAAERSVAKRPAPPSDESIESSYRYRQQGAHADILTAGSFDDHDDLKLFERVWNESPLASMQIAGVSSGNWRSLQKSAAKGPHDAIQVALVIDTTGSMGDELDYLQAELRSMVKEVNRTSPTVKKEFAIIVYRDEGDAYVTRGLNFTSDMNEVQSFIDRQDAAGGGDYPEAVHTALEETWRRLSWSSRPRTAKMAFLVADAPAHDDQMSETFRAVEKLADTGIVLYPVAASGVMDAAEAMMRAAALMTGGQYIFLTDDSGVGNSHALPKHPCYNVEKLKVVMTRMIKDRIAGKKSQAVASQIIRSVGSPNGQQCPFPQQYVRSW